MVEFSPLCSRAPQGIFAHCLEPSAALSYSVGPISVGQFLGQVQWLAAQLPPVDYIINLCQNRYLFTLGFCATITAQGCNLLPGNLAPQTLQTLLQQYPRACVLHDGQAELPDNCDSVNLNDLRLPLAIEAVSPQIALQKQAAVAFTSGSTGSPKPNIKSWHTLVESTKTNARYMIPRSPSNLLATVPAQHMWGLETSVLMPLFADVAVVDTKPFYPQDLVRQLSKLAVPRVLVTTPVHLRALLKSGLPLPQVERVLCATAPLSCDLAEAVELACGASLVEIYGCSEVGSMACRATAHAPHWQLFDTLKAHTHDQMTTIVADHLPAPVSLQDQIVWFNESQFQLCGRHQDMLEVAGKRGSLLELNRILLAVQGVIDGAVFMPSAIEKSGAVIRPVALVVAEPTVRREHVVEVFKRQVDPVFIPRPIHFVAQLPRDPTGKLRQKSLEELWQNLIQTNSSGKISLR